MIEKLENKKNWLIGLPGGIKAIAALVFLAPFAIGLYYDWLMYAAGVIIVIMLAVVFLKRKTIVISKDPGVILLLITGLGYFAVIPFAVDSGMAFAGGMRMLVVALFILLVMQYDGEEVRKVWQVIPASALLMLMISLLLWVIPSTKSFVASNAANQLGGFFQYANAFGLYQLLAIVVLMYRKDPGVFEIMAMLCLAFGIFMTGSRFIFVLMVATYLWFIFRFRSYRKILLLVGLGLGLAVALILWITRDTVGFGRFSTLFQMPQTLYNRIIGWKDALRMLKDHWYGLGYYGYQYLEPAYQTADYYIRFVHNDWLQVMLDAGIIPGLCCVVGSLLSIKGSSPLQKLLFVLIAVAGAFDFNIAYGAILFLWVLCLNVSSKKIIPWKNGYAILPAGIAGVFIWLGISFGLFFYGRCFEAVKIYPGNTEARIDCLSITSDLSADEMATEILERNDCVLLAYNAKAAIASAMGDYESMMAYKDQALIYDPYDLFIYEEYLNMLSDAAIAANNHHDRTLFVKIAQKAISIPDVIQSVLDRTDPLADKGMETAPDLTLPQAYLDYIEMLRDAIE